MAKNINALVATALDAAHAYGKGIDAIRAALKGQTSPDDVRATLMGAVSAYYGVPLVDKTRGEGKTWDKEHGRFETAKKAHQRICADVLGKAADKTPEIEVPAHIAKLAAQLVKACGEYEGAAKLIATAIAEAKAGK